MILNQIKSNQIKSNHVNKQPICKREERRRKVKYRHKNKQTDKIRIKFQVREEGWNFRM